MTATTRQVLHRKIDEIAAAVSEAAFVVLRPRILIHEPNGGTKLGGPCPCCSSVHARVVEERALPEMAIDCESGRRVYKTDRTPEQWVAIVADADSYDVPLRLSRTQAAAVLEDDGRHILASGGNRSAKTTAGLVFLALQWLRRGGRQRRFWLVGSSLPKAFRLLEKLFLGTGESPPILPRALVRSMPATPRASSLLTTLVDGSLIDLRYFENDPGAEKLKSDAIVCALVDEAAHLPAYDSLVALEGRCFDDRGRLFLATTPRPDHFLKEVVENAQAFDRLPADDERRTTNKHKGAMWRAVSFAVLSNPWLDPEWVEKQLASKDPDDPAVRRDFYGEWAANSGPLWRDFSVERHIHLDEARTVADMRATVLRLCGGPMLDITPQVVRRLFQAKPNPHYRAVRATNTRFILSSDFNCHPMSTCVLQVVGDVQAPEDRSRWHVFVLDVVQSGHSNSLAHAEKLVDLAWTRIWAPAATEPPFKGCGMICDPQAIYRDPTSHKHGRDARGLAETLGKVGLDGRAPQYQPSSDGPKPVRLPRYDSHTLVHKLLREGRLHLSQRCSTSPEASLVDAFLQQQDSGDGVVPLTKTHTKSDRLASPMDALRYGLWGIFHG